MLKCIKELIFLTFILCTICFNFHWLKFSLLDVIILWNSSHMPGTAEIIITSHTSRIINHIIFIYSHLKIRWETRSLSFLCISYDFSRISLLRKMVWERDGWLQTVRIRMQTYDWFLDHRTYFTIQVVFPAKDGSHRWYQYHKIFVFSVIAYRLINLCAFLLSFLKKVL